MDRPPRLRHVLCSLQRLSCETDQMLEALRPSAEAPQADLEKEQEQLKERTRSELLVVKKELGEAASKLATAIQ